MTLSSKATVREDCQLIVPRQIVVPGQMDWLGTADGQGLVLKPISKGLADIVGMLKADHHVSIDSMSAETNL
jgi:hypothetical protein